MRNKFGETLIELFEKNDKLYFVTADAGNAKFYAYAEKHPNRYINVGIAEQNMAGFAAGLALEGKTVIVNSIGNFPTLRCIEQIRNDIAYHDLDVKICTTGGGLSYGPAGVTHHASEDFSIMRAIPNMCCFAPGDAYEVEACTKLMVETPGPCYMRVGYVGEEIIHTSSIKNLKLGKAIKIIDGNTVAIFTAGSILNEGYKAADELNDRGISTSLYSFPTIKPIDTELIIEASQKYQLIISLEENNIIGGFGSAISEVYSQLKEKKAFIKMIGLKDEFPTEIGTRKYLDDFYKINAQAIIDVVTEVFK